VRSPADNSWGGDAAGKHVYCAPPDIKRREIMNAFEGFLRNHPRMAGEHDGAAIESVLSHAAMRASDAVNSIAMSPRLRPARSI
jgi:hypothetical protein